MPLNQKNIPEQKLPPRLTSSTFVIESHVVIISDYMCVYMYIQASGQVKMYISEQ